MPRSRSRSIESSSCGRWLRASTVPVSSRMRSASVDFPWSMWAMIEKLRMCWSGRDIPRSRLVAAPEAAGDQAAYLVRLLDAQRDDRADVDRDAGADPDPQRHDLGREGAAERLVEPVPDAEGDAGEEGGGAEHLRHRLQARSPLDALQQTAQLVSLRRCHRERARDAAQHDARDPERLV